MRGNLSASRLAVMSEDRENFGAWFVEVLESLYRQPHAGFAILMIAFPLLERYVRQKANLGPDDKLTPQFYAGLLAIFPELQNPDIAKDFWGAYRNGILHQASFSTHTAPSPKKPAKPLPGAMIRRDINGIVISPKGGFQINPVDFTKRAVQQIEDDFDVYVGASSGAPQLAKVRSIPADEAGHATHLTRDSISATLTQSRGTPIQYQAPPNTPQVPVFGTSEKPSKA